MASWECPNCGAPLERGDITTCHYCGVFIGQPRATAAPRPRDSTAAGMAIMALLLAIFSICICCPFASAGAALWGRRIRRRLEAEGADTGLALAAEVAGWAVTLVTAAIVVWFSLGVVQSCQRGECHTTNNGGFYIGGSPSPG